MAWYQTRNYPSSGIYPQYNTQLRYFTATPPVDTNTKNLNQSKKKEHFRQGKNDWQTTLHITLQLLVNQNKRPKIRFKIKRENPIKKQNKD